MARSRRAPGYYGASAFVGLMLVAYLVMAGVFWGRAPARVPSHFTAASNVDDWSTKGAFLLIVSLIGVGVPILFAIPWPWDTWSGRLSVPNKDYWLKPGRRSDFKDRVTTCMRFIGGLVCGMAGIGLWDSLTAATAYEPDHATPDWEFPVAMGVFGVGMALSVVKLFRDLRVSPEDDSGDQSVLSSHGHGHGVRGSGADVAVTMRGKSGKLLVACGLYRAVCRCQWSRIQVAMAPRTDHRNWTRAATRADLHQIPRMFVPTRHGQLRITAPCRRASPNQSGQRHHEQFPICSQDHRTSAARKRLIKQLSTHRRQRCCTRRLKSTTRLAIWETVGGRLAWPISGK